MTESLFDLLPETIAARRAEQVAAAERAEALVVFRQWVQYGVLLAGPDGATFDAWVCPCCGTAEVSAYVLSTTHGVDARSLVKLPDGTWTHELHGFRGPHPIYGHQCGHLHHQKVASPAARRQEATAQTVRRGVHPPGSIHPWFPTREAALAALNASTGPDGTSEVIPAESPR